MLGGPLSLRDISGYDSVERIVEFTPPKGLTYDPRLLFNGVISGTKEDEKWQSGFFDKGKKHLHFMSFFSIRLD